VKIYPLPLPTAIDDTQVWDNDLEDKIVFEQQGNDTILNLNANEEERNQCANSNTGQRKEGPRE